MQPTPPVDPLVAQMKQTLAQSGYQPPAPTGNSNWQTQVKSKFDQSDTPSPAEQTGENYMNDVAPGAEDLNDIATDISGGKVNDGAPEGNIGKAADEFAQGGLENDAKGAEDATLGVASDAASAIFAPLAAPLQTLISHASTTGGQANVDSPEAIAARQSIADWAKAHPTIAKTIGDAVNVGSSILGSEALDTTVSDAATGVKNAVVKTASNVKDAATAAKGLVTPTPAGPAEAATNLISQDPETMTQGMKNEAVAQGRQTITPNKGGTEVGYKPTAQIERAGQILSDPAQVGSPITAKDAPNVVVAKVKSAIATKGAQAEKFLEDNPEHVSNQEASDMVTKMKASAERTSTPVEMKAYSDQLDLFQKQLEDQTSKTGTLNTSDYYKALKNYETEVASKFKGGKTALADPEGIASAKIQAASDIRSSVRDMIGAKHSEFQSKMQDIASLYEARDNAIFNAGKTKSSTFLQNHPTIAKVAKTSAALATGAGVTELGKRAITGAF